MVNDQTNMKKISKIKVQHYCTKDKHIREQECYNKNHFGNIPEEIIQKMKKIQI